ncbi:MAG: invasin domain 3-containing protein [Candidatus Bathyarchaeia archaeon]
MKRTIVRFFLFLLLSAFFLREGKTSIYTIQVDVNPKVVPADGTSNAVVTAQVREEGKGLVSQSLRVDFATTLGTITPWVYTEGGVARAEITSTKQGIAVITISCMGSTVQTNVTFVSEREFLYERKPRAIKVKGDYLAWCADKGVLDATGNVKVIYGDLYFEGDSFQIDAISSVLRALGRIKISNNKKQLVGDRLFWDFTSQRGILLEAREEVKTIELEGIRLNELAPKGYIPSYAFEFYDPADSRIIILAKEADIFPGEKVYLKNTTTFVGGSKVFSLPYQLIRFSTYGDYTQQMLNWGTSGVALDFPYYFALREN